ncbi:MAG: polysulfide reductase NrfD [Armatimonadetes bacterium]|nr:polysulfide reductase NrfD [Armatimonadota bacterium]MDE2207645.1 polysulfide reductase NrfD [Armatimonadota bacterium]
MSAPSFLKKPVWTWEVPAYFFLGGLSAGAYLLSRAASAGTRKYRGVAKSGLIVAVVALLPCPALLVSDLGDPRRFHHMLRVFKPVSPMNLGAWTLVVYSSAVVTALAAERPFRAARAAGSYADTVGVPAALLLAGYTGVLLSTTANPAWAGNPWIGPLFSAGAIAAGADAIELVREVAGGSESELSAVRGVASAARVVEAATLAATLRTAAQHAPGALRPRQTRWTLVAAVVGIVLPAVLELLPVANPRLRRSLRAAGCAVGLAGGAALRFAVVEMGRNSITEAGLAARDVEAVKENTRGLGEDRSSRQ